MIPPQPFRVPGEGEINGWALESSSRIKSSFLPHVKITCWWFIKSQMPTSKFLEIKINTLVNEFILLSGLINRILSILLWVSLPLTFPTPTQLFFFVSSQIQRERNYFLNFSFYYVNICEQINCECGFHPSACLGPHILLPTHWGPPHLAEMSWYPVGWL